jgi:hypothetical protein
MLYPSELRAHSGHYRRFFAGRLWGFGCFDACFGRYNEATSSHAARLSGKCQRYHFIYLVDE